MKPEQAPGSKKEYTQEQIQEAISTIGLLGYNLDVIERLISGTDNENSKISGIRGEAQIQLGEIRANIKRACVVLRCGWGE